jgi:hypothetical protein
MSKESLASIHFRPCIVKKSLIHNLRKKDFDYVFKDLTQKNEYYYFEGGDTNLVQLDNSCRDLYKANNKRKLRDDTAFIKEAVVNIKEDTTLEELIELCKQLEIASAVEVEDKNTREKIQMPGWKPLQIFIHRDEGKVNKITKEREFNLHAHIVFDCQDKKTGKLLRLEPAHMSKLQDITSEVLSMKRGVRSTKKGLTAIEYKSMMIEREMDEMLNQVNKLLQEKEININALEELKFNLENSTQQLSELTAKIQSTKEQQQQEQQKHKEKIKELKNEIDKLKKLTEFYSDDTSKAEREYEKIKSQKEAILSEISGLNVEKQEASEKVAELASKVANLEGEKENAENYIKEANGVVANLADMYDSADELVLVWNIKERLSKGMNYKKLSEQLNIAKQRYREVYNEEMSIGILLDEDNIKLIKSYETPSFPNPKLPEEKKIPQEQKEAKLEEKVQEEVQKKNPTKQIYAPKNYGKKKKKGMGI